MADTFDPFANSVSARTQLLDRLSSGERVDPQVAGSIDTGALTDQGEFAKGLRRFGYSTDATTRAFAGQMLETVAPRFSKPLLDSAVETMQRMPQSVRPEYETFEEARKDGLRGLGSYAASTLGEGLPSTALILASGGIGGGVAKAAGARAGTQALARYGAGMAAVTPLEGGETAMQLYQDPQAMANTTPAERTALTLGRGTVNAFQENLVPQLLIAPRLMGQAARIGTGLGNAARNTALIGGAGAVGEYGTEVGQDLTGQMALKQARGEEQGDYNWAQANEAGIKGAITGGVTGGVGGAAQALYSNIGQGVDNARDAVRERLTEHPADRFVAALRAMSERPEQFGADAANMTLDALAKATTATSAAARKVGPKTADALDASVDAVGALRKNLDKYIINNVSPENREYYADLVGKLGSMTAGEYKLFTAALRAETGKEFQENITIAGRSLSKTVTDGARTTWDTFSKAAKGFSDTIAARRADNGERQSFDISPSSLIARAKEIDPALGDTLARSKINQRGDITAVLAKAVAEPSYFQQFTEEDGRPSSKQSEMKTAILSEWKRITGTDLLRVADAIRAKERDVETSKLVDEPVDQFLFTHRIDPELRDTVSSMANKESYDELSKVEKLFLESIGKASAKRIDALGLKSLNYAKLSAAQKAQYEALSTADQQRLRLSEKKAVSDRMWGRVLFAQLQQAVSDSYDEAERLSAIEENQSAPTPETYIAERQPSEFAQSMREQMAADRADRLPPSAEWLRKNPVDTRTVGDPSLPGAPIPAAPIVTSKTERTQPFPIGIPTDPLRPEGAQLNTTNFVAPAPSLSNEQRATAPADEVIPKPPGFGVKYRENPRAQSLFAGKRPSPQRPVGSSFGAVEDNSKFYTDEVRQAARNADDNFTTDENGNLVEVLDDATPFDRDAYREAMANEQFSGRNTSVPVRLSSDRLNSRQLAQIFGRKVKDASGKDVLVDYMDEDLSRRFSDTDNSLKLNINPMSLYSMTKSEKFRERFMPHVGDFRPGVDLNRQAGDTIFSALSALSSRGIEINPADVGLPGAEPIRIKADVDLTNLPSWLVLKRTGSGENREDFTFGDYTGKSRRAQSLGAQQARLEEFEGNFEGASQRLSDERKQGDKAAKAILGGAFKYAKEMAKAEQVAAIRKSFAARLKKATTDEQRSKIIEARDAAIKKADDAKVVDRHYDAAIERYVGEVQDRIKQDEEKADARYEVDALRAAVIDEQITVEDIRDLADFYANSDKTEPETDEDTKVFELLDSLNLAPVSVTVRDEQADKLFALADELESGSERSEKIMTGRAGVSKREADTEEFKTYKLTGLEKANTAAQAAGFRESRRAGGKKKLSSRYISSDERLARRKARQDREAAKAEQDQAAEKAKIRATELAASDKKTGTLERTAPFANRAELTQQMRALQKQLIATRNTLSEEGVQELQDRIAALKEQIGSNFLRLMYGEKAPVAARQDDETDTDVGAPQKAKFFEPRKTAERPKNNKTKRGRTEPNDLARRNRLEQQARERMDTVSVLENRAEERQLRDEIKAARTTIRLKEIANRIKRAARRLGADAIGRLREAYKAQLEAITSKRGKTQVAAPVESLETTIANTIAEAKTEDRLQQIAARIKERSSELDKAALDRLRQAWAKKSRSLSSGEKQSLDTGAKQNKAPENKLADDYIAAIAESKSGGEALFEGALDGADAKTTSAILNTLFDKERAKFLHDNLEDEGLTEEEEQEVIDAAKNYFEFLSKQGNLNFDNTSPKDLEATIGQAIDQAATAIRLEAIGKRIAARTGELSKEATERLREKYKAKKEALKNPSKPSEELTEAQKEFVRRVEQLVGKRVAVLFNQNLGIGVAGSYMSRETALDRVREERVAVIDTLKTPFAEREGNQTDAQLQKALDRLNAEEQKILKDDATLGIIRVATGMEERAGLAEHEAFHGAFQFFFDHNKEDRRVVVTAFSRGIVNRRLREYFKDSPAILDKITPTSKNFDEEETAAYGFQVWMYDPSALKLGEGTQTIFEKIKAFFRGLFNIKTHEERALEVLEDLRSGKRAERGTSPLARQLDKNRPWTDRAQDFAKDLGGVIKSGFDMLLSGTYSRLMDFENPAIATIARLGYNMTGQEGEGMVQRTRTETTRYYNELSKITEGMTEEERLQLQKDLVLGNRPTDGRMGRKYDQIKALYADLYQYQTESGMQLGERKDYYPMIWDAEKVLENKEAFLTMLRQDKYKEDMRLAKKTPDEIWRDITAYFDRGDSLNNVMGTDNEPVSESSRKRSLSFIEPSDRVAFMASDPVQTGSLYIKQAVRHAEFVRAYGLGGSRLSALKRDAQKVYGATPDQIGLVNDYIDGLMGNKGINMSRELKDTYGALVVYQNYRLLPFSLFSSLVDPMGIAVRSNSIGDAWDTFSYSMKNLFKEWKSEYTPDEWETIATDFGIITRAGTTVNADNLYTGVTLRGTTKKLNDAFFKYNLLNGWIRNNHIMAVKAAQQFMYRASQDFFKGEGQNQRYLEELGVTKDDIIYNEQLGRILLTKDELEASGMSAEDAAETAAKLRAATQKFVRQALLNPSSAELANWASNPYLAPIAHLKQFVWSFNATIIKRISHELENQNYAPIMMAAAYVPAMIAADFLKDMISNFGEEPPYKKDWDVVDYAWQGVNRAGLTGTGQFFVDAKEDIMRGGGGYESLAGPSLEQLKKAVAAFGSGDEAAMERWFVKSLPANAVFDQFVLE